MGSMIYQVQRELQGQLRIGDSRREAKLQEQTAAPEGIFSYGTLETYLKQGCAFARWAKAQHGCNTLAKARPYAAEYLQQGIDRGLSASTLSTQRAALCKLYHCKAEDMGLKLPERSRSDIFRSRNAAARDYGFSIEKNTRIIAFVKATGLRRHELAAVKPCNLREQGGKLYLVEITGKGGKVRTVEVLKPYETIVRELAANAPGPEKRIFRRVPSHMDVHGYRREYAQALYNSIARPAEQLSRQERYVCRKDKAGVVYDKKAMLHVSRQLGHNRISVIAGHYL